MPNTFKALTQKYVLLKKGWSPQQNLFYGFFTYILLGFVLLCFPIFQKQSANIIDHLFIATSAVSTTGLVTISVFDTYNIFGQFIVMALFQLGGIGYLTFTTFMLLSTTRKMTLWHKKILSTEFTLPKTIKINDFLKSVVLFTFIMELLGTILFFIAFKMENMPTLEALWSAIFHSVSTFCTAGFSLFSNSFVDFADHNFINFIISMLAISGSLGFIVITDFGLLIKNKAHKLSFTTKIIFYGFLILLTFGTVFFYFFEPTIGDRRITFLGRVIPYERLYIATSAFIFYTVIIVIGTFLITITNDFKFETILFEVASALGTVGISTGITGDINNFGKIVIILLMFIGRLGVLTFGLAIWHRNDKETPPVLKEDIAV